jgi:hypothetical protein
MLILKTKRSIGQVVCVVAVGLRTRVAQHILMEQR